MKKSLIIVCLLVLLSGFAAAQTATTTVNLTAKLNESVTISVANGPLDFGQLTAGDTNDSNDVDVTTTWLLGKSRSIRVKGYFSSASALTADNNVGYSIPTSAVTPIVGGSALASPFSGTTEYELYTLTSIARRSSNTTQLGLRLALTDPAIDVIADDYSGTLNLRAEIY